MLSTRSYEDIRGAVTLVGLNTRLINEEKRNQIGEGLALRKLIKDLNTKIDLSVGGKIDRKVNALFEKLNQENIKVWETCVDYSKKLKQKDIGKLLLQKRGHF